MVIRSDPKIKFLRFDAAIFFFVLVIIFFHQIFLGRVPMPMDALVGAYYPWLDFKWGYSVGVPFKNIALSDVFSQLYPWRILSIEAFRRGQWPLWNPYSLSGTPLLANWQSAPFYPLNILMLLFGDVWGWVLLIICQPVLSLVFMYLYLKQIGVKKTGRLIGSVIFAFSGFMITYMQYATIGQIMLWLPLQLYLVEKYVTSKKYIYLSFYSLTYFPVLTGGFFQPAFYVIGTSLSYAIIRVLQQFRKKIFSVVTLLIFAFLGVFTAAVQLIPTLELYKYSIRTFDQNIIEYQYGLLPLRNIVTFLTPDFFGNPATNNFWGFLQYQETSGYFSVIAVVLIILAFKKFNKNIYFSFFTLLFFISLIFSFNNPISVLVYRFNISGLSSGYASRFLMLTSFSASILAALGSTAVKYKNIITANVVLLLILTVLLLIFGHDLYYVGSGKFSIVTSFFNLNDAQRLKIAMRNMILPVGILLICLAVTSLLGYLKKYHKKIKYLNTPIRNTDILSLAILVLISMDLLRYGLKFTPFSPLKMTDLSTQVTDYLKANTGNFRIEREWGPVMPPNTWIYPHLYSSSGYDPLAIKQYARWYQVCQYDKNSGMQDLSKNKFTRYLEADKYDSPCLDLFGVKYLVAIKRNNEGEFDPDGTYYSKRIPAEKFKEVYSDGRTAVLENISVLPRAILYDEYSVEEDEIKAQDRSYWEMDFRKDIAINKQPLFSNHMVDPLDSAAIVKYSPNEVVVETATLQPVFLLLTDTYYPGWKVSIDGKESSLLIADGIFKAAEVPAGVHKIIFKYNPGSFKIGLLSSIISIFILLFSLYYEKQHENIRFKTS